MMQKCETIFNKNTWYIMFCPETLEMVMSLIL